MNGTAFDELGARPVAASMRSHLPRYEGLLILHETPATTQLPAHFIPAQGAPARDPRKDRSQITAGDHETAG
jgi:hypothetical protein